jgi:hypothetical protein
MLQLIAHRVQLRNNVARNIENIAKKSNFCALKTKSHGSSTNFVDAPSPVPHALQK